ncbi:hypothetical protein IAQ61_007519 [Plenodomus lingam]|uniref:uncharacterized protein n=1 Tax=Leptosphaeria maculans TaxID=5022 RepID=UPI0033291C79|nr:hypothetical protein IAQ61_007519 [Plenodomus lingam]
MLGFASQNFQAYIKRWDMLGKCPRKASLCHGRHALLATLGAASQKFQDYSKQWADLGGGLDGELRLSRSLDDAVEYKKEISPLFYNSSPATHFTSIPEH